MPDLSPTAASRLGTGTADTAADRSDTELLLGLRAHQHLALEELYERYFLPAYALAVRMLAEPALAEECVQAVFLHLWQHPPSADPAPGDVSTGLLWAIHQQARTQQRLPGARRPPLAEVPPSPTAGTVPPSGPGRFAARLGLAAQQQAARAALATLPPVEHAVLELAYFHGMAPAAIAATLVEPPETIQTHLRAGLEHLRTAGAAGADSDPRGSGSSTHTPASPAGAGPAAPPLTHLTTALAGMEAAQQRAADLRHRARAVRHHAQTARQRAAAQQQQATATLQQLGVLQELYAYLDTQLTERAQPCDQTFAQTEAYFAQHPQQIDVSQVAAVLAILHAHCDCEAYRLLPGLLR